jgi:hypothetical protein
LAQVPQLSLSRYLPQGFTLLGLAWHLHIPPSCAFYGNFTSNSLLEFLTMMITPWLVTLDYNARGLTEECILILGDNTSAIGWLFHSRKLSMDTFYYEAVQLIACKLAELVVTDSTHILTSQHLKGEKNIVADLLSYTGSTREELHPIAPDKPSDSKLTQRFHSFLPQLIPRDFAILLLPAKILSFFTRALQTAKSSWICAKSSRMRAKTAYGIGGLVTATKLGSKLQDDLSSLLYLSADENSSFTSPSITKLTGLTHADFLASV